MTGDGESIAIRVRRKEGCDDLPLPQYMSTGSSGMDLYADVTGELVLPRGGIAMVSSGISISLPEGYEAQIRPRSGLAAKHGISIVNSPGTVDADYRGIINIILINFGPQPFIVTRGMRIAQMVINRVTRARLELVEELDTTTRNAGGFGHTGV